MQWIISDVHGCYYTLRKLIKRVQGIDDCARFVFVGDFTDRGPWSKEVVDCVLEMQDSGLITATLRGNHDDTMDEMLNGQSYAATKGEDWEMVLNWYQAGLKSTLKSYGVQSESLEEILPEFRDLVPESHKLLFRSLPIWWESDTHFACHAYCDPDNPHRQTENANRHLWDRFSRKLVEPSWDKIGVFGHTPVSYYGAVAPIELGNLRLIDTCAFAGEYLCGYCCEADSTVLQASDDRDRDRRK